MSATISRIEPKQNLTTELADMLRQQITSGQLTPGEKLPTEQQLLESAGVSRTVVREAVASLKAEGLLIARQGVGVFVATPIRDVAFRIDQRKLDTVVEFLKVTELRVCVEAEAAALAAARRTASQMAELDRILADFAEDVAAGGVAVKEDIAFHALIASASGNAYFESLLYCFRSCLFVSGQRVLTLLEKRNGHIDRMRGILREHEAIHAAIRKQSPEGASKAMRQHLEASMARYRAQIAS